MKKMSSWLNKNSFNEKDEYYTPPILVEPILKYIPTNSVVWCPFDTERSEFVVKLIKHGCKVIYTHITYGQDFFDFTKEWIKENKIDYIVSNPPFTLKKEIVERLFDFNVPFALIMGLPILNYQEIGELFFQLQEKEGKDLQLLIVDKKVSFDGNTASFNNSYFCYNVLPKQLMFAHLENNNANKFFVGSQMKKDLNKTIGEDDNVC